MTRERAPLLTRKQVEELGRFRPTPYLITSLYLDIPSAAPTGRGRSTALRSLSRDAMAGLDARDLSRKQRRSVEEDIAALTRITRDAAARGDRAVAAFLSAGVDYEQVIGLPHPAKNRLIIDERPYVRPLAAMLAEFPRYLVVLADRSRARLLGVHLGRVQGVREIVSDVPAHVREGGYRGNAERGIARHIEDHVTRHLKAVAEVVRDLTVSREFDRIVLGGPAETAANLRDQFDANTRWLVAGDIQIDLEAPAEEIALQCADLITRGMASRDRDLMERLGDGLASSGMATAGVLNTLGALRRGAVATLLVADDFAQPGSECRNCGFLGLEGGGECPACGKTAAPRHVPDLVREMIDQATGGGADICHIASEPEVSRLRAMGGAGALLRFRLT